MRKFFKTVAIVTVFSMCEKFLGFIYRIFLSRSIGSEGVGLYQVSLSVFAFLLTLICSGTPITVSRLMTKYSAENNQKSKAQVISAGIISTLILSSFTFLLILLFKNYLHFLFADVRCVHIFLILSPGLIFTSIYSVLRGVFWGNKDFLPYSIIELLEEVCMIVVGIILISNVSDAGEGAKRASLAVLISFVFSFSLASTVFFIEKNKLVKCKTQLKPLLRSATPITLMRTSTSLSVSLVSILLPIRLVAVGYSNVEALSLYGSAVGQAMPILFIPTTLIGSFIIVLVPEIAENFYNKKYDYLKNDVEKSIRFTTFLSCLFIAPFFVCGEEIGVLIFNSVDCGKFLTVSAFLMVFMGISTVSTSILNSLNKERKVLLATAFGGILMVLSIIIFPKLLNIFSLLVGYTLLYGFTTVFNLILINKTCVVKPKYFKHLLTSVLLVLPTCILGLMLEKLLLPVLGTLFTFLVCSAILVIFYIILSLGFSTIDFSIIKSKFQLGFFNKKRTD